MLEPYGTPRSFFSEANSGLVIGGPLDGRVIISNTDYWCADALSAPLYDVTASQVVVDYTVATVRYVKVWRARAHMKYYEWRLTDEQQD